MYLEMTSSEMRLRWAPTLRGLLQGGPRIMIHRHGDALAGLVSAHDLRALEAAENNSRLYEDLKHGWKMKDQDKLRSALDEARQEIAPRGSCLIR